VRCSSCSEEIKPIVAVDIDGTLGDYHTHFIEFAESWLGHVLPTAYLYDGRLSFKEHFRQNGVLPDEWHQIKLAYRQGGMKRSMPIYSGAAHLCGMIRGLGAELWLTTTRPYLSLDNVVPDTVAWLDRHGIEYDGLLFDEDKYTQLATRINPRRVCLVLDDLEDMCRSAASILPYGSKVAVLVLNDYNPAMAWPLVTTLEAAVDLANVRISQWEEEYGSERHNGVQLRLGT
jgi:hypothetical protein